MVAAAVALRLRNECVLVGMQRHRFKLPLRENRGITRAPAGGFADLERPVFPRALRRESVATHVMYPLLFKRIYKRLQAAEPLCLRALSMAKDPAGNSGRLIPSSSIHQRIFLTCFHSNYLSTAFAISRFASNIVCTCLLLGHAPFPT